MSLPLPQKAQREYDVHSTLLRYLIPDLAGLALEYCTEEDEYTIFDSAIAPINIHALEREMPRTNLLNYEFTFDIMCKILGMNTQKN